MKQFAFFYREDKSELCGSDSYLPLDGRWNLDSCYYFVNSQAKAKHLKDRGAKYFRICIGTILNPHYKTCFKQLY